MFKNICVTAPGSAQTYTQEIYVSTRRDLIRRAADVIQGYAARKGLNWRSVEWVII